MTDTRADLHTENLGTIIRIAPQTRKGLRWMRRHVYDDATVGRLLDLGSYLSCDHRCGLEIIYGALAAGLRCRDVETGRVAHG